MQIQTNHNREKKLLSGGSTPLPVHVFRAKRCTGGVDEPMCVQGARFETMGPRPQTAPEKDVLLSTRAKRKGMAKVEKTMQDTTTVA